MTAAIPAPVHTCATRHCRKDKLPIGAVVIRRDSGGRTRFIKVREDGPPAKRWAQYSRWWWETNRGAIPPGQVVVHLNGRRMDDRPANFGLASIAHNLTTKHRRNPEWSRAQLARAHAGTAEFNRFAGRLHRLRELLVRHWYPVVDSCGVIFNVPFRRRRGLLEWFGVDVSDYAANGRLGKVVLRSVRTIGMRPVRGAQLGEARFRNYVRFDPALGVGGSAGGAARRDDVEQDRVAQLLGTELLRRAEEAARLDMRARK